jgi:hypothetical protein
MATEDDIDPVCVQCDEGPYSEEEWHLKLYTACVSGCCKPEWFHVKCFNEYGICPKDRYTGPKCILCDEGPYLEEVWHLMSLGCCERAVYHPACTIKLIEETFGEIYYKPIRCPYCELDPTVKAQIESCLIM